MCKQLNALAIQHYGKYYDELCNDRKRIISDLMRTLT